MALGPEDIGLSKGELNEADELEIMLDKGLHLSSLSDNPIVLVIGSSTERVRKEVMSRYRKKWSKVEYNNGQVFFTK